MQAIAPLWDFTDCVPMERRQRMLSVVSFDEVIPRLQNGTLSFFNIEPRNDVGRVSFRLSVSVSEETYDAFFNSPHGYRAQYCLGTNHGEEKNGRLMSALAEVCIKYSEERPKPGFSPSRIVASLTGAGAKVWIIESDLPDLEEVHINYEPWVKKAQRASIGATSDQAARANAGVGVLAPVGTQLEIKGAWIFPDLTEWHDPKKVRRAEEIRDYGFT